MISKHTIDGGVVGVPSKSTAALRVVVLLDEILVSCSVHVGVALSGEHDLLSELVHIKSCGEQSSMATDSSISVRVLILNISLE